MSDVTVHYRTVSSLYVTANKRKNGGKNKKTETSRNKE